MITIAPSDIDANRYFIFRDSGLEVSFEISGNRIICDTTLTEVEYRHIRRYYIKKERKMSDVERIMDMYEKRYTYDRIAEIMGTTMTSVFNIVTEENLKKYENNLK